MAVETDYVKVTLEYNHSSITFPINPEQLKEIISSDSVTEKIENIGEISIPQTPSLSTITFESFFWADRDTKKPSYYVNWIKNWQKSRKPAELTVSRFNWNMKVTCESFSHWVNAGEENDIYFQISLKEYREYGAKRVKLTNGQYVIDEAGFQKMLSNAETYDDDGNVVPVTFDSPRATRSQTSKPPMPNYVYTAEDDSITSLTKKYTGDTANWEDFYETDKKIFGDSFSKTADSARKTLEFTNITTHCTTDVTNLESDGDALVKLLGGGGHAW